MRLSVEERDLMTPGSCRRCGIYSVLDRNSAGRCTDCHNLECRERRAVMAVQRETKRAEGRAYWDQRGIAVGQRVKTFAVSMLWQTRQEVHGIAKVGKVGAYVSSGFQRGYLSPDGWTASGGEAA